MVSQYNHAKRLISAAEKWLGRRWLWIPRIFATLLIVNAFVPTPPRALLDSPPHHVETLKPDLCMHTRLIDEVEEWKIQRTLQLIREMGASTIVEFFPWAYVEGTENVYDWHNIDRIVQHAQNQGLHIIARLGLVPEWARKKDDHAIGLTTLNTLPEAAYPDFAQFVADFAARYAGIIDHIIIWNEPNLAFEWGYQQVDPVGYARLLQAVYQPAHKANPNVIILAAGLAPTLEPPGSPNGLEDTLYLQALYDSGAAPYFDALAVHTYGFTEPPEETPGADVLNFRRVELLRQVMVENGDANKHVYITETGWNDHPRWTKAVTSAQRIEYTIGALQWAETHWDWVDVTCLWVFRYPQPTLSYPDNFTFANTVFQLQPIYYAVQAYARGFAYQDMTWHSTNNG